MTASKVMVIVSSGKKKRKRTGNEYSGNTNSTWTLVSFENISCQYLIKLLLLLLLLSRFSRVWLCATPPTAAHRLPHPWDSPGRNTGVGCHFVLQCMKVKSESEVAQSCPTLSDPTDCSPPGSCVHGILQARFDKASIYILAKSSALFSTFEISLNIKEKGEWSFMLLGCRHLWTEWKFAV